MEEGQERQVCAQAEGPEGLVTQERQRKLPALEKRRGRGRKREAEGGEEASDNTVVHQEAEKTVAWKREREQDDRTQD